MAQNEWYAKDDYAALYAAVREFCANPSTTLSSLCNIAALLYSSLSSLNWCGFYLLHNNELVLGPFQGKVACERIELGKGVCGKAALERKPLVVPDVHAFVGHIACDSASESELVIPLLRECPGSWQETQLLGVLDIDAPIKNRFTQEDLEGLLPIAQCIASTLNFNRLL